MALDSLNLCIAYTRFVKKSVGRGVKKERRDVFLLTIINMTVLRLSEKSCDMTAIATISPTAALT